MENSVSFETQTYNMGPLAALSRDISQSEKIYCDLIKNSTVRNIKEYNYLVNHTIPKMFMGDHVLANNIIRTVTKVRVKFPTFSAKVGAVNETKYLTPLIARRTCQNYMCKIYVEYTDKNTITRVETQHARDIGSIECMVGSNRCITSIKPDEIKTIDEWKMQLGEDPSNPGGYFIKGGAMKILLYGEKLATNTFYTILTKKNITETRMTELVNAKTIVYRLHSGVKKSTVKYKSPHLKYKHYPIFLVFYLLSLKTKIDGTNQIFNVDDFAEFISKKAPKKDQPYVKLYLKNSIIKFYDSFCDITENGVEISNCKIQAYITKKIKDQSIESSSYTIDGVMNILFNEIAPSVHTSSEKMSTLATMVAQQVRCCLKLRPFDNRDSWNIKKIDSPVRLVEQVVDSILSKLLTFNQTGNDWSIGKNDVDENIVESYKIESSLLKISMLTKINPGISSKTKKFESREVPASAFGMVCPAKTSEGQHCGLHKNMSICLHVSYNREHIKNRLSSMFGIISQFPQWALVFDTVAFVRLYVTDGTRESFVSYVSVEFIETYKSLDPTRQINERFETYEAVVSVDSLDDPIPDSLLSMYGVLKYNTYSSPEETHTCSIKFMISDGNEERFLIYVSDKFKNALISRLPNFNIVYNKDNENKLIVTIPKFIESNELNTVHNTKINVYTDDPIFIDTVRSLLATINDYVSLKYEEPFTYGFTYNGNLALYKNSAELKHEMYPHAIWVNPDLLIDALKNERRHKRLPMDCCIYKNEHDKLIQYFDDSGRLMSPYLVSNKDGDLVLDTVHIDGEKFIDKLWPKHKHLDYSKSEERVDMMYKHGVIELIDTKELEKSFISQDINEFRRFANLRRFLNNFDFENSDSLIKKDDDMFINYDIAHVKINKKNYNVKFTTEETSGLKINARVEGDKFVNLYGKVEVETKKYTAVDDVIIVLNKVESDVRDGYNLCTITDGNVSWIEPGNVGMDDTKYDGKYIVSVRFPKGTNSITRKLSRKGERYTLEKTSHLYLENVGKEWFYIEDEKVIWVDGHVIDERKYNFVEFNGLKSGYFKSEDFTLYIDLMIDSDCDSFDLNKETKLYDEIVAMGNDNDRESDLLMSFIRDKQSVLDIFETESDPKVIFDYLRSELVSFTVLSNIYKVFRYLNWRFKFTHAPVDPNIIYSANANAVPKPNCNQGPRFTYQCAMGSQALGLSDVMHFTLFETSNKRLIAPEQHNFETVAEEALSLTTMPTRKNIICAVMIHPKGFEDAVIMHKSITARYEKEITITVREHDNSGSLTKVHYPVDKNGNPVSHEGKYKHLDMETGLPRIGSIIGVKDCIVGMIKVSDGTDMSRMASIGQDGEVTQINISSTEDPKKERIIRIKITQRRFSQPGDKSAIPYSQKGTSSQFNSGVDTHGDGLLQPGFDQLGDFFEQNPEFMKALDEGKIKYRVVDDNDMPRVIGGPNDGMAIHMLFSPFSFPSRMTLGMNFEMLTGKAALRLQEKVDATGFHFLDIKRFEEALLAAGLDRNGEEFIQHSDGEISMNCTTGKQFKAFICPLSNQYLRHNVHDKISQRAHGANDQIVRQPVRGRERGGGQRFGEMEVDALKSYGANGMYKDRLLECSDKYTAIFCDNCKNRTSESDIIDNICKICGYKGKLIVSEQPRIASVLDQQLKSIGLNITYNMK